MNFKAQTKVKTFLDWLRAIRAVSDDCIFDTSELDAVEVRVVDPANAQMVIIRMPDHAWDVLEVEAGRIGIDLERMIAEVEMFDPDADITISTEDRESITTKDQKLQEWLNITDGSATFGLQTLDPTRMRKPPAEPTLGDLPAQFHVDAERFRRAVKRAESVDASMSIGMEPDGSVRVWTATDSSDYEENLLTSPVGMFAPAAVRSMFAIDYLRTIVDAMRGDVVVQLGQDMSVRMTFVLHAASVTYIQAPRIE